MILLKNKLSITLISISGKNNYDLFRKRKIKMEKMTPGSSSFTNPSQLMYLHLQDLSFGPVYLVFNFRQSFSLPLICFSYCFTLPLYIILSVVSCTYPSPAHCMDFFFFPELFLPSIAIEVAKAHMEVLNLIFAIGEL